MSIIKEFKTFAIKGNVIDMAVGIIIGVAFGAIVASLVKDVIMPPIGLLLGGVDFSSFVIPLKAATDTSKAVTLNYGLFINTIINFLIVALAIFFVVKAINSFKKKEEEKPAAPPEPTKQEILLTEIRDLLQAK